MISILRKSLLFLGWGGIIGLLALAGLNRISSLSADLSAMEAKYATLQNQLALLAFERQISQEILLRHEEQLSLVHGDLQKNLGAYSLALRDSEQMRDWSALALPADLAGLLRSGAKQPAAKPDSAPSPGQSDFERGTPATGGHN